MLVASPQDDNGYQGMCFRTPPRISSAAAKAATTAQLSRDNSQLFFTGADAAAAGFTALELVSVVFAAMVLAAMLILMLLGAS
jgi:hypothetical protein